MSFNDVHPGDPIDAVNVQQIIDALKGTAGKGVPLSPTAVNNATNYALTVENLESTNSRALNVLKSDGSTLIKADATGVTLGSPITAPAASLPGSVLQDGSVTGAKLANGTVTGADLANGTVTNANLGPDVARAGALANGGFEIWQRGNGPFTANAAFTADRWQIVIAGTDTFSVTKSTSSGDTGSLAEAAVAFTLGSGGGASGIVQYLKKSDDFQFWGKTVSFSIRAWASVAGGVRASLSTDGTGGLNLNSAYHTGGSAYQTLTLSGAVPSDATYLAVGATFGGTSSTYYLDNAMLVLGSQYANYVPLHPADDLARCLRYYEPCTSGSGAVIMRGYVTGPSVSIGDSVTFKARKAVVPSITVSGASLWSGVSMNFPPQVGGIGTDSFDLHGVSTGGPAAAVIYTNADGAGWIAEANP